MKSVVALWKDDAGVILSAEAVVVGTVAVVGLTAGMSVVATSVNEELKDVGMAIRSLDQSYVIPPQEGCGAKTAGRRLLRSRWKSLCENFRRSIARRRSPKSSRLSDFVIRWKSAERMKSRKIHDQKRLARSQTMILKPKKTLIDRTQIAEKKKPHAADGLRIKSEPILGSES